MRIVTAANASPRREHTMLRLTTENLRDQPSPSRAGGPYRIERRRHIRRPTTQHALAVCASRDPAVYLGQLLQLELRDLSRSGLAAVCEDQLPVDQPVTIYMPADRRRPSPPVHGHVVRCRTARGRTHGRGCYQIAIAFDPQPAA